MSKIDFRQRKTPNFIQFADCDKSIAVMREQQWELGYLWGMVKKDLSVEVAVEIQPATVPLKF